MKRLAILLVSLQLAVPLAAHGATPIANFGQLGDLIETQLADQEDTETVADDSAADAADDGAELDEEGKRTLKELQGWAEAHPEEFAAMLAQDEGDDGDDSEDVAAEEPEVEDAAAYCANPNDPSYIWEAKAHKKSSKKGKKGKRGKKSGARCTAAALKTNISVCCLLFVRTKLGLPSGPTHAKDYGPVLTSHGYCKTSVKGNNPVNAPVGAVMIYSGGVSGHIELKRGPHAYWWGPTNSVPATQWKSKKRVVKAIYTKCGGKKKK